MKKRSYPFYYGWVIVGVSFLTLFFVLGSRSAFGLFYMAILEEYGWGRGETAGAFSLLMLLHGFLAPISGILIDRLGARKLFPVSAVCLAIGLALLSRATAIWHLYLFLGVIVAIGSNALSYSPHMSLIPRWFTTKRGFASGVVLAGIGTGVLVHAPLIEYLIGELGWRNTFLVLSAIMFCVVSPINALFHRRSPEEVGQHLQDEVRAGHGGLSSAGPPIPPGQWTLTNAFFTKSFWWLAFIFFNHGIVTNTMVVHQALHVVDMGYSHILAASLLGLVGLLGSLGGALNGHFSDHLGRKIPFVVGSGFTFMGILVLLQVKDDSSPLILYLFAILYGLGNGGTAPVTASLTVDLFPGNSMGRIFSIYSLVYGFGGALGPYVGGYFYDRMGSYVIPFCLLLLCIGAAVFGLWKAAPRKIGKIGIKL